MTAIVVYDSLYGNTEKLARLIAETLEGQPKRVSEIVSSDLSGLTLLVVGSPTQGGRPTKAIQQFLQSLTTNVEGVSVAAFDTRISETDSGFALRILLRAIGYAAPRIDSALRRKGGYCVATPAGFLVEGREGPLRTGELDRAIGWAQGLKPAALASPELAKR